MSFEPDDWLITPEASLLEAEVDGEIVGLSLETDRCFGFNDTATFVWKQVRTPMRLSALVGALVEAYEVDRAVCEADVRVALQDMAAEGLVRLDRTA